MTNSSSTCLCPPIPPRPRFTTATYCDIQGTWPGEGNISQSPKFANPSIRDYRLLGDSPCIDAGKDTASITTLPVPRTDF